MGQFFREYTRWYNNGLVEIFTKSQVGQVGRQQTLLQWPVESVDVHVFDQRTTLRQLPKDLWTPHSPRDQIGNRESAHCTTRRAQLAQISSGYEAGEVGKHSLVRRETGTNGCECVGYVLTILCLAPLIMRGAMVAVCLNPLLQVGVPQAVQLSLDLLLTFVTVSLQTFVHC